MRAGDTLIDGSDVDSVVEGFEFFIGGLPEPYRGVFRGEQLALYATTEMRMKQPAYDELSEPQEIDESKWASLPTTFTPERLLESREQTMKGTDYLDHFEAVLGAGKQYTPNRLSKDDITVEEREKTIKYKMPREEVLQLCDLLRKMLRYDPARRITIDEVINHPWTRGSSRLTIVCKAISNRIYVKELKRILLASAIALLAYLWITFLHSLRVGKVLDEIPRETTLMELGIRIECSCNISGMV
jgi:serine/threonine protein kinase